MRWVKLSRASEAKAVLNEAVRLLPDQGELRSQLGAVVGLVEEIRRRPAPSEGRGGTGPLEQFPPSNPRHRLRLGWARRWQSTRRKGAPSSTRAGLPGGGDPLRGNFWQPFRVTLHVTRLAVRSRLVGPPSGQKASIDTTFSTLAGSMMMATRTDSKPASSAVPSANRATHEDAARNEASTLPDDVRLSIRRSGSHRGSTREAPGTD